jgi:uncharacterized membrane protein YtjA (UPF0391 family)
VATGVAGRDASQALLMLSWAFLFLVLGIVASVLGFAGIASAAVDIAKILFLLFVVLLLIDLVGRALRK